MLSPKLKIVETTEYTGSDSPVESSRQSGQQQKMSDGFTTR